MTDKTGEVTLAGEPRAFERIAFAGGEPLLLTDAAKAREGAAATPVPGYLFLPDDTSRPSPAVVVCQGLGGVKPEREMTYGHKLAAAGHVVLVPDSFAARDLADADDKLKALAVSTWTLVGDAFAALRWLAGRPEVDAHAVSIMGFSWGGMVAVLTAYEQVRRAYMGKTPVGFAGHASYYGCSMPRLETPRTTGAPVLMLVGERDENVSLARTREICGDLERGGSEVDFRLLDGYHQWDGKDVERRHVLGALSDIAITVRADGAVVYDGLDREIDGLLSEAISLLHGLRYEGYDIQRDETLHRTTDRLLLDFLAQIARRRQARAPVAAPVAPGALADHVVMPEGEGD